MRIERTAREGVLSAHVGELVRRADAAPVCEQCADKEVSLARSSCGQACREIVLLRYKAAACHAVCEVEKRESFVESPMHETILRDVHTWVCQSFKLRHILVERHNTLALHDINPPTKPQSSMADDAVRALLCIIEGESSLFRVKPTCNMDIIELKKLIREEGINTAEHAVLAKDLTLWKVRMIMASDSATNSLAG
jgi:hypothetical protein